MKCPQCDHFETSVVYTRNDEFKNYIKRGRKCLECNHRFMTFEEFKEIDNNLTKKEDE